MMLQQNDILINTNCFILHINNQDISVLPNKQTNTDNMYMYILYFMLVLTDYLQMLWCGKQMCQLHYTNEDAQDLDTSSSAHPCLALLVCMNLQKSLEIQIYHKQLQNLSNYYITQTQLALCFWNLTLCIILLNKNQNVCDALNDI